MEEEKEKNDNQILGVFIQHPKSPTTDALIFFDLMVISLNSHSQEFINAISPKDLKIKTKLSLGDGIRNHHIPCICSHSKCLKIK